MHTDTHIHMYHIIKLRREPAPGVSMVVSEGDQVRIHWPVLSSTKQY